MGRGERKDLESRNLVNLCRVGLPPMLKVPAEPRNASQEKTMLSMSMSCCFVQTQTQTMEMVYFGPTVFPRLVKYTKRTRKGKFRSAMDKYVYRICPELREEMAHFYKTEERPLNRLKEYQIMALEDLLLERAKS